MAARLRPKHQDEVRDKIRASQLINRLQDHVFDKKKILHASQVNAALGLLKKCVPDLTNTQLSTDPDNPLTVQIVRFADAKQD